MKVILALFLGALVSSASSQGFSPYRQVSRNRNMWIKIGAFDLLTVEIEFHGKFAWANKLKSRWWKFVALISGIN